jgi:D-alanyl-D-alanine carboxypeptidase-like protein
MTVDLRYPTPLPSTKGWGAGWPNCQANRMVSDPIFVGGVRAEIAQLVDMLAAEIHKRGYTFEVPGCWGFDCRATKGGSGTVPSFHSWGLALDFNAPQNPFGAPETSSDIAMHNRWIVGLMATYGFFWLGPSIGDWMHFSFAGSPTDAVQMTAKAHMTLLGGGDADVKQLDDYIDGREKFRVAAEAAGGDPGGVPASWNNPYRSHGWHQAREEWKLARGTNVVPPGTP